jgi:hypothetical protein
VIVPALLPVESLSPGICAVELRWRSNSRHAEIRNDRGDFAPLLLQAVSRRSIDAAFETSKILLRLAIRGIRQRFDDSRSPGCGRCAARADPQRLPSAYLLVDDRIDPPKPSFQQRKSTAQRFALLKHAVSFGYGCCAGRPCGCASPGCSPCRDCCAHDQ